MSAIGILFFRLITLSTLLLYVVVNAPPKSQSIIRERDLKSQVKDAVFKLQSLFNNISKIKFNDEAILIFDQNPFPNDYFSNTERKIKDIIKGQLEANIRIKKKSSLPVRALNVLNITPECLQEIIKIKLLPRIERKSALKSSLLNHIDEQVRRMTPLMQIQKDEYFKYLNILSRFVKYVQFTSELRSCLNEITMESYQQFVSEFKIALENQWKEKYSFSSEIPEYSALNYLVIPRTFLKKLLERKEKLKDLEITTREFMDDSQDNLYDLVHNQMMNLTNEITLLKFQ